VAQTRFRFYVATVDSRTKRIAGFLLHAWLIVLCDGT
jgi:hypothetical protein